MTSARDCTIDYLLANVLIARICSHENHPHVGLRLKVQFQDFQRKYATWIPYDSLTSLPDDRSNARITAYATKQDLILPPLGLPATSPPRLPAALNVPSNLLNELSNLSNLQSGNHAASTYSHVGLPVGALFLEHLTGTSADYADLPCLPVITSTRAPEALTVIAAILHIKASPLKRLPVLNAWNKALINDWNNTRDKFADYLNSELIAYCKSHSDASALNLTNACIAYLALPGHSLVHMSSLKAFNAKVNLEIGMGHEDTTLLIGSHMGPPPHTVRARVMRAPLQRATTLTQPPLLASAALTLPPKLRSKADKPLPKKCSLAMACPLAMLALSTA